MKTKLQLGLFCGLACCVLTAATPAAAQVVQSTTARQASVTAAQHMLESKEITTPTEGQNPFYSPAFVEAMGGGQSAPAAQTVARTAGPRTDRDILTGIAATMKPSGYFVLGNQPTLVFGQKRVKAGSAMTINFEGGEYTVEITAIDRTSFTLRLNREEYTRPIK